MVIRKAVVFTVFLLVRETWTLRFHEVPQHTAVLIGSTAQLNCNLQCVNGDTCKGLIWSERISSATGTETDIYYSDGNVFNNNNPNRNRYSIVPGTINHANLLISNVTTNDTGRYICKPDKGAGSNDIKFAYLTVLENIICQNSSIAVEGGNASVTCSVKFHKTSDPEDSRTHLVTWRPSIKNTERETENRSNTEVTVTAYLTDLTRGDNGRICTCRTFYTPTPPSYNDTCNTYIVVEFPTTTPSTTVNPSTPIPITTTTSLTTTTSSNLVDADPTPSSPIQPPIVPEVIGGAVGGVAALIIIIIIIVVVLMKKQKSSAAVGDDKDSSPPQTNPAMIHPHVIGANDHQENRYIVNSDDLNMRN